MKWISVKDKLPEYTAHASCFEFVAVLASDGESVFEALYEDGSWEIYGVKTNKITHWMPMPDPPNYPRTIKLRKCNHFPGYEAM